MKNQNKTTTTTTMRFPAKLYRCLEEASNDPKLSEIISWLPSGKAFKIHDPEAFTEDVMPLHFAGMNSFKSFRRQLNLYGIKKQLKSTLTSDNKKPHGGGGDSTNMVTAGTFNRRPATNAEFIGCYFHSFLQRNRWELVEGMTRHIVSQSRSSSTRHIVSQSRSSTRNLHDDVHHKVKNEDIVLPSTRGAPAVLKLAESPACQYEMTRRRVSSADMADEFEQQGSRNDHRVPHALLPLEENPAGASSIVGHTNFCWTQSSSSYGDGEAKRWNRGRCEQERRAATSSNTVEGSMMMGPILGSAAVEDSRSEQERGLFRLDMADIDKEIIETFL